MSKSHDGRATRSTCQPGRVFIADRHAVARAASRLILEGEPRVEVVGEAGGLAETLSFVERLEPDVVLLGALRPGLSCVEAVREVLAVAPRAQVIVLGLEQDPIYARQALAAGASGYLLAERVGDDVVAAVREVLAGRRYVSSRTGHRGS